MRNWRDWFGTSTTTTHSSRPMTEEEKQRFDAGFKKMDEAFAKMDEAFDLMRRP